MSTILTHNGVALVRI